MECNNNGGEELYKYCTVLKLHKQRIIQKRDKELFIILEFFFNLLLIFVLFVFW